MNVTSISFDIHFACLKINKRMIWPTQCKTVARHCSENDLSSSSTSSDRGWRLGFLITSSLETAVTRSCIWASHCSLSSSGKESKGISSLDDEDSSRSWWWKISWDSEAPTGIVWKINLNYYMTIHWYHLLYKYWNS